MNVSDVPQGRARLSDEVARGLERWIREEGLQPGTQLPTEKVLGARFGVSRPVIREAIARLKADGCVRTRQGSGAFVAARPGAGVFRLPLPDALPQDAAAVFELRYVIETAAAALAAERRTDGDLLRIGAALECMRKAIAAGLDAAVDDDAFHVAIAEATHNPPLARFQQFMGQQFSGSRMPTWSPGGHRTGRARDAQDEHERIFEGIAAADPVAARRAAAAHLTGAAKRLGLDPSRWSAVDQLESE